MKHGIISLINKILNFICYYSIVLLLGSTSVNNSVGVEEINRRFDSCTLFISSPYNCTCRISIYGNGFGKLVTFIQESDSNNVDHVRILGRFSFNLSPADTHRINEVVSEIFRKGIVLTPKMFDTFEYKLFINKKKFIQGGKRNEDIYKLLSISYKYFKTVHDQCGFFRLFKQNK